MGTLVAMRYPTRLALGLADHTYVKCANGGKAWSCWGGKTGGTELRRGEGSTARADAIAGHDEKAGIRCYLVNGVCHQCANRILLPASITVRGAKGYGISEIRFGTYGRPRGTGIFSFCIAPFNQYPNVTGDLPECVPAALAVQEPGGPQDSPSVRHDGPEADYLKRVTEVYGQRIAGADPGIQAGGADLVQFMVTLFDLKLEYNLGGEPKDRSREKLRDMRMRLEKSQIEIEEALGEQKIQTGEFVKESDRLTISFQKEAAGILNAEQYQALFDLRPGEFVGLADPSIVEQAFPAH